MALKLYAVSIMAMSKTQEPGSPESLVYWEHSPHLVWSDSVNGASEQARTMAFRSWHIRSGMDDARCNNYACRLAVRRHVAADGGAGRANRR
jgi:hypothetical protein